MDGLQFQNAAPTIGSTRISGNARGVVASGSSVDVGTDCDYGGWSSIFGNSSWELWVSYGTIYAQKNWWGYPGIPTYDFYYGPGGNILAWCYLTEPPPSASLGSKSNGSATPELMQHTSNLTIADSTAFLLLAQAFDSRRQGNYQSAVTILNDLIVEYPNSCGAHSALMELCKTFYLAQQENSADQIKGSLEDYLITIANNNYPDQPNANDNLYRWSQKLLANEQTRMEKYQEAIVRYQYLSEQYQGSQTEEEALYDLFSINLFLLGDEEAAKKIFADLQAKFPLSEHIVHAKLALGEKVSDVANKTLDKEMPEPVDSLATPTQEYRFSQNYPNPFNPETEISYSLSQAGHVRIEVYNVLGQKIVTLFDGQKPAGNHTIRWDGRNEAGQKVSSGIYLCRMQADGFVKAQKMTLLP